MRDAAWNAVERRLNCTRLCTCVVAWIKRQRVVDVVGLHAYVVVQHGPDNHYCVSRYTDSWNKRMVEVKPLVSLGQRNETNKQSNKLEKKTNTTDLLKRRYVWNSQAYVAQLNITPQSSPTGSEAASELQRITSERCCTKEHQNTLIIIRRNVPDSIRCSHIPSTVVTLVSYSKLADEDCSIDTMSEMLNKIV